MSDAGQTRPTGGEASRADALSCLVGLGSPGYRRADVMRLAGIEHDRTVRWWRAMGFPEVPEDVPAFAELDIEIAKRLAALTGAGLLDDDSIMRLARLLGTSFSRIAETQVELVEQVLAAVPGGDPDDGTTRPRDLATVVEEIDESMLGLLEEALVYVWRRHLFAALGRRLETDENAVEQAVGFVDLSGFARMSQSVAGARLAELVDAFERVGFDVVSARGGRVIKLIGDEIMFVAPTLPVAVDIALDLADRFAAIDDMPGIHCGIAVGPTVTVGGDVFGATVNLAARLTTLARRDTILLPSDSVGELADRDDLAFVRVRRAFEPKGMGPIRVTAVRRAGA